MMMLRSSIYDIMNDFKEVQAMLAENKPLYSSNYTFYEHKGNRGVILDIKLFIPSDSADELVNESFELNESHMQAIAAFLRGGRLGE